CQAGDESAFGELVERYSPRLRFYLRKMLGVGPAAEDALQDVWLDAVRAVAKLLDPGAFPAWIYRLARDRACRTLRRRRIYLPLEEEDLLQDAGDSEAFSADDVRQVHAALDTLRPEHREVVVLRFLEDMSYDDIARVVGCQVGTVRSRLHYAKRALRRILEGTDRDE
ncbi:MAG TPA: sigma-70 family RNA polymerase sigma factor, partial [Isosphaeraceae bacterium]|nr:sigma-70 family RNA polymerase sigma factor [Isosphaeraceae bacterium]